MSNDQILSIYLILLVLPRGQVQLSVINDLAEQFPKLCSIEFKCVLGSLPKQLSAHKRSSTAYQHIVIVDETDSGSGGGQ